MPRLQKLFFILMVKPILLIVLGINLHHPERLPKDGPAVMIANHNSHMDTPLLMNLFPLSKLPNIRPIAAADYFFKTRWLAWFATNIMNIIPIARRGGKKEKDPLEPLSAALDRGEVLIFFPEGTRGEPEQMTELKSGLAHLIKRHPHVPVYPIFTHGLGKAMPKGDPLIVPFTANIHIGKPLYWQGDREQFMAAASDRFRMLREEGNYGEWE
ncbi:1-acyl-sn-glycerol-3-phosphate acyltransferase [Salicibibacter cibi]|uniref:1-acyl-sn-glycerol-3-phosphate acyltransferase n=1 Tax=Salicibibacter cibi TaxID=2743001 RepID=A0A7T6ZBL0_9BACI|nr:lysophospholipid acyltransferase family protein [Salicibibacter cibi]QQK80021.1 1-acyl-sn-glycerol-3-phosphate acyltransferase [Salicibibacter cibi]